MVCLFNQYLVGGCTNPFEKYAQVNSDHETPRFRVNITNIWSHLEIWLRIYRFQSLHSTQQMMIGNHGSEPNGRAKVLLNAWLPPMYGRLRQSWFHCEAAVGPQLEVCWPRFTSNHHFSGAILVSEVVDPDPSSFTLFQIYETNSSPKMKIEPVGRYHSFFNLGWHLGPFSGPKWQFQGGYHNEWEKKMGAHSAHSITKSIFPQVASHIFLVGGFNPHLKNMIVKIGSSSPILGVKIPKNIWVATT